MIENTCYKYFDEENFNEYLICSLEKGINIDNKKDLWQIHIRFNAVKNRIANHALVTGYKKMESVRVVK